MADIVLDYSIKIVTWSSEELTVGNHWTVGNDVVIRGTNEITDIVEGSLSWSRVLCSDGLKFGEACSDKFEVDVYSNAPTIANGLNIEVYAVYEDPVVEVPLFKGRVDSCQKKSRYSEETHLEAYDEMYYIGETDITDWWNAYVEQNAPFTLQQSFNDLIEHVGVEMAYPLSSYAQTRPNVANALGFKIYEPVKVINSWKEDDDVLTTTRTPISASKLTFRALLSMFCEIMLCFPKFDEYGKLKLVFVEPISSDLQEIPLEETVDSSSSSKGYLIDAVDGVKIVGIGSTGERLYLASNETPTNPYVISNNALLSSMSELEINTNIERPNQLVAFAQRLMGTVNSMRYTPLTVEMVVSNLFVALGGQYRWDGQNSYTFKNEYSGSLFVNQKVSSGGSQTQNDKTPYSAEFKEKTA